MEPVDVKPNIDGAVTIPESLYCFHQGLGKNGELWFNWRHQGIWSGDQQVSHIGMSESPAAVAFNGLLYCFHQGLGKNGELWFTTFDGTNWTQDQKVPQRIKMSESPAAVFFNGLLYCFHQGEGHNGELWFTTFDGTNWTQDQQVSRVGMSGSPAVGVTEKNNLYCFYQGKGQDGELWFSMLDDGGIWSQAYQVSRTGMSESPSVFTGQPARIVNVEWGTASSAIGSEEVVITGTIVVAGAILGFLYFTLSGITFRITHFIERKDGYTKVEIDYVGEKSSEEIRHLLRDGAPIVFGGVEGLD